MDPPTRDFPLAIATLLELRALAVASPDVLADFDDQMRNREYELALDVLRFGMERDGHRPTAREGELFLKAVAALSPTTPVFDLMFDEVRQLVARSRS